MKKALKATLLAFCSLLLLFSLLSGILVGYTVYKISRIYVSSTEDQTDPGHMMVSGCDLVLYDSPHKLEELVPYVGVFMVKANQHTITRDTLYFSMGYVDPKAEYGDPFTLWGTRWGQVNSVEGVISYQRLWKCESMDIAREAVDLFAAQYRFDHPEMDAYPLSR